VNKIFKFAIVGVLATFVHSACYFALLESQLASPQQANILGFLCAFFLSFFGQMKFTFNKKGTINKSQFFRFSIASGFSFLLNAFWVFAITDILSINPDYALLGIIVLTPILSFFIMNRWVFK